MSKKRLLWQLFFSFMAVIFLVITAIFWYVRDSVDEFHKESVTNDLRSIALLLSESMDNLIIEGNQDSVDNMCRRFGNLIGTRITVIKADGTVMGDSEKDPEQMENHADRSEVIEAKKSGHGSSIRFSNTIKRDMIYVALPIKMDGKVIAVVRTSLPLKSVNEELGSVTINITLGILLAAIISGLLSLYLSARIARPLEQLKDGAERYARGELSYRLPEFNIYELEVLSEAMNEMSLQLKERLERVTGQRNEQEAVLSSMVEGVMAIDTEERIISMNNAAGKLMQVLPEHAVGRTIHEIVRNTELQNFATRILATPRPQEKEIVLHTDGEKHIQAHGTLLRDSKGRGIGAVVVLNDITQMRRLEEVRRDFVANVSHELKTPVTSIKGFVETLIDGAVNDVDSSKRFLEIVGRQADRLNAIIEDLLTLSRIEQEAEKEEIPLERHEIKQVLQAAIVAVGIKANQKNIKINLNCENNIKAEINAPLLEQAVVNLIDNAVKYSNENSAVEVAAKEDDSNIAISVTDHGAGIGKEYLPRLFERFYRVDKARSRKLGGTGLGLAIVKHIVLAHGGKVYVNSTPGKGSIFSIELPNPQETSSEFLNS